MRDRGSTGRNVYRAPSDSPRLRVVFVLPALSERPVGGYKVVYSYANHLAAHHDVTIIHALNLQGGTTRRRPFRARVWRAWTAVRQYRQVLRYHVRMRTARPTWYPLDDAVATRNVAYLGRWNFPPADIAVATAVHTAPVTATVCRRTGAAGVYFIQSYEDWMADRSYVDATWRLPLTKLVIADWLVEKGAQLGVQTTLVPNGIDIGEFPPGPPTEARPYDVVAMASDLPEKRLDVLVDALEVLGRSQPGVRAATFGVMPRPSVLPDWVEYTHSPPGSVLSELYRSAKVYLCTSDSEGWHLPPAEAMSSGAAVVSTDIGGVMTYARGVCLSARVGDAEDLAAAVLQLLGDTEQCQQLAQAGQERIRTYAQSSAAAEFERQLLAAWRLSSRNRSVPPGRGEREHDVRADEDDAPRGVPLVTAIVPAYNSAEFIRHTLDSLAAQTWPRLEVIVGDDASTDDTVSVVQAFAAAHRDVRVVQRGVNLGWLKNTNDLMSRASGDLMFLAFHDDTIAPTYVEELVQALDQNPRAVLAFSDLTLVDVDGTSSLRRFRDLDGARFRLARGVALAHSPQNWWVAIHGMFRTRAFQHIGGLRPNDAGEYGADWPWIMHLALLGEFVRVPRALVVKTAREGSVSRTWGSGSDLQRAVRRVCVDEVSRSPLSWPEKLILRAEIRRRVPVPSSLRPLAKRVLRRLFR
jgi:glycosyltransferase involved in cell wall biosynthesis